MPKVSLEDINIYFFILCSGNGLAGGGSKIKCLFSKPITQRTVERLRITSIIKLTYVVFHFILNIHRVYIYIYCIDIYINLKLIGYGKGVCWLSVCTTHIA